MWKRITQMIQSGYTDEAQRRLVMFNLLNLLLAGVAAVMTVLNLHTEEYELMAITAVFSSLCLMNVLMLRYGWLKEQAVVAIFTVEAQVLLVYFVLGGIPEGFSVLWTLLVPAVSLYVFGQKIGIRFSLLTFFMVIFFFWCPFGQSLLYYGYNKTFMLRFPFVYICLFLAALYIDIIRLGVISKLKQTEETARELYRHDALTGIYNRYAFSEEIQRIFVTPSREQVSAMMFDIDDFKQLNDCFGHNAGDEALKAVARILEEKTCEHCLSCRWGGEEFLVLMRCGHDPMEIAETIRRAVEETVLEYDGMRIQLTVSAGVTTAEALYRAQVGSFINCADKAMYESKAAGKNQTTFRKFGD